MGTGSMERGESILYLHAHTHTAEQHQHQRKSKLQSPSRMANATDPPPNPSLVLTCVLPILLAFLLFSYLFLAVFANLGDWKTVLFDSPPLIKFYAALIWAMTIVMLALDAATVDKGYKNEVRILDGRELRRLALKLNIQNIDYRIHLDIYMGISNLS